MSSAQAAPPLGLELVGSSHKTAPIAVLEKLALSAAEIEAFYERVGEIPGVHNAMVLSTCNRTEIYALAQSEAEVGAALTTLLRELVGDRFPGEEYLYRASGRDGLNHLFRVASGLDSLILGEAQILGQVKAAFDTSVLHGSPSPFFERVLRATFAAAKRSRSETDIGRGAVSVAGAAVHLATRIYSNLDKRTVVVVGAGDTARLLVEHFGSHSPRRIIIVNRTLARAEALARSAGAEAWPWEKLTEAVASADVAACAVRSETPILNRTIIEKAIEHRGGRTLALLDVGLPRNVAADVNALTNVFVGDIEALKQVVDGNLSRRKKEVTRVEGIIREEVDKLLEWQRSLAAGPVIAALRESVEQIRQAEVAKACAGLSTSERNAVERATRAVVNKLLHGPMMSIRELTKTDSEEGSLRLAQIRRAVDELKQSANVDTTADPIRRKG